MRMSRFHIIFRLALLLIPSSLFAAPWTQERHFKRISVNDGLYSSIAFHTLRVSSGVMWVGLSDGVDRYDGYEFKHYDLLPDTPGLEMGHKPVNAMFQVSEDEFWVGSGPNLLRYDIESDKFELLISNLSAARVVNQISSMAFSGDSICYLGTNFGIFRYNRGSGKVKHLDKKNVSILSLHLQDGILWIGTSAGQLFYDVQRQEFIDAFSSTLRTKFSGMDALSYYFDPGGEFALLGTRSKGLLRLDLRRDILEEVQVQGASIPHIRAIRKYGEGFVLGTDGYGVIFLNKSLRLEEQYRHDEDNQYSLSNNGVYDIFIDPEDRIWISTYGGGLNLYDPNKKPFRTLQHLPYSIHSLGNNVSRSFLEVGDELWFGTANGISILNQDGTWKHILGSDEGDQDNVILSLCKMSDGTIWAGTFSRGIVVLDRDGRSLRTMRNSENSNPELNTDYIYEIFEDSYGNIWIGGIRGELICFDPKNGARYEYEGVQNVRDIIETAKGEVFVATLNGVVALRQGVSGIFELHSDMYPILTELDIRAFSIFEQTPGEFWIGTEGAGLLRFSSNTGDLQQIDRYDGLSSNTVYGILSDHKGDLWLSTTSGLACIAKDGLHIRTYNMADGLSGKDFNYGAYLEARDGTMYFGGSEGVTYFHPGEIFENPLAPSVVLTDISIYGKNISNSENPFLEKNINQLERIELDHNQNSFSIDFAAINYTSPQKNQYRWILKEFGKASQDWSPISSVRSATFSYLPPGHYLFQVQASNNDGVWNRSGKVLEIFINPPFWKTPLAVAIYIFLTLILFIVLLRVILTFSNQKQANEKIRFFINIAHDIRTPLTLIKAPVAKLALSDKLDKDERAEMELARNNAERLNRLVNQLLDFQKATLNRNPLRVAGYDLPALINEVLGNFQPLLDKRLLRARIDLQKASSPTFFDRQKIEKVLYNLLSNAIKYSSVGGEIVISLNFDGKQAMIKIKDYGRGIPAKQQKEIFKRYFRAQNAVNSKETGSGVGLMLSKKLIEIHRGNIDFKSEEDKGTEFIITFPVSKETFKVAEILSVKDNAPIKPTENETLPDDFSFTQEYTILVAEDNTELRNYIKSELQPFYNVVTSSNGKEAFEKTIKLDIDLIISDIMMPEVDGNEFCMKVKAHQATSHIPFILLTALNTIQDKIQGLEFGADDYIEKPFDILYLKARIMNLLKSREKIRRNFKDSPGEQVDMKIGNKPDQKLMVELYNKVMEQISRDDFTVEEMCRLVGMSRPVLYRKLKAYTGHSPQEYLIILRLNKAAGLIKRGHMTIKEVAYESGFSDPKYFSKSFKKQYGLSPTEYLKSGQES